MKKTLTGLALLVALSVGGCWCILDRKPKLPQKENYHMGFVSVNLYGSERIFDLDKDGRADIIGSPYVLFVSKEYENKLKQNYKPLVMSKQQIDLATKMMELNKELGYSLAMDKYQEDLTDYQKNNK